MRLQPLFSLLLLSGSLLAAATGFHVLSDVKIGGEGGWDYPTVDSAARRLYLSHATKVVVVDINAKKVVGEIADTPGVHGIAIAPKLNRGFTSNGRANTSTIFDLKTLKPISQVKTGENPDAILYDEVSNRVFTFNGKSKDVTAFKADTGAVEGTIPVGGKPEFSASDDKGKIYVNIEDKNELIEIDSRSMKVTKHVVLTGCDEPSGLAIDTTARRVFSVCGNKMMAITALDTYKVLATVPIGEGADGVVFDRSTNQAFSSNGGDGNITVVGQDAGKWKVMETIQSQRGARTIAMDAQTHQLYLPTADLGPAPAATKENPEPRPKIVPNTFRVIVVGK